MASIDIYVPIYMDGEPTRTKDPKGERTRGEKKPRKAYQFAKLTAVVLTKRVPEGAVCINSRAITVTPPEALQPPEATPPTP